MAELLVFMMSRYEEASRTIAFACQKVSDLDLWRLASQKLSVVMALMFEQLSLMETLLADKLPSLKALVVEMLSSAQALELRKWMAMLQETMSPMKKAVLEYFSSEIMLVGASVMLSFCLGAAMAMTAKLPKIMHRLGGLVFFIATFCSTLRSVLGELGETSSMAYIPCAIGFIGGIARGCCSSKQQQGSSKQQQGRDAKKPKQQAEQSISVEKRTSHKRTSSPGPTRRLVKKTSVAAGGC